jgi:hypothetical protein
MSKPQKLFRYIWRVNAILILVAAGAVTFGVGTLLVSELGSRSAMRREADAGPPIAGAQADPRMSLGQASVVPGTHVMRAQLLLYRDGGGFSSGGYSETRNILFIQPGEKAARWLLPDNQHVLSDSSDLVADHDDPKTKRTVATAALVKPATTELDVAKGKLLLFDPSGNRVVEVADGVRKLQVASLASGEITLLYERDRRLVLATFDAGSFARRGEQEMDVPQLK